MWDDIKWNIWYKHRKLTILILILVPILIASFVIFAMYYSKYLASKDSGTIADSPEVGEVEKQYENEGSLAVWQTDDDSGQLSVVVSSDGRTLIMTTSPTGEFRKEIAEYTDWKEQNPNLTEFLLEGHKVNLTADTEYIVPEEQRLNSSIKDVPEGTNIYTLSERDAERYIRSLIGKDYELLEFIQYNVDNTVYWESILSAPDKKSLLRLSYSHNILDTEQGVMIEVQNTEFHSFLYPLKLNSSQGYRIE